MKAPRVLTIFWHSVDADSIPPEHRDGSNPTASMFRDHLRFLLANYSPISIHTFLELVAGNRSIGSFAKPPVLLGFDDGFKNVITNALPILHELRVPATFFVIGEVLKDPEFVPWFVEVKHSLRRASRRRVVYGETGLDLNQQQDRVNLMRLFEASFRTCRSEADRQRALSDLAGLLGVARPRGSELDEDLRFVDGRDLAEVGASPQLTLASHAMTHRHLADLRREEQFHELEQSDRVLRQHCQSSYCPVVAYPGGSFNADTTTIAKGLYRAGFAVSLGSSYRDLYAYPRIGINQDTVDGLAYAVSPLRRNYLLPLKRFLNTVGIRRAFI